MIKEKEINELRAGKLKLLRQAYGLNQKQAAFMMDMNFLEYTYYELGKAAVNDAMLEIAAKCYDVKIEYLINNRVGLDELKEILNIPRNGILN